MTDVAHGAAYSGHYRQLVLIQRCSSITEVAHGAVYSGHYRQVVFLHKWSLRQVSLHRATRRRPKQGVDRWSELWETRYTEGLRTCVSVRDVYNECRHARTHTHPH